MPLPASGLPLPVTASRVWRGKTVPVPIQAAFTINGMAFHLPVAPPPNTDLQTDANLTQNAKVTVSGVEEGYGMDGAVDGVVGGYPDNKTQEWSSGGKEGSWLRLGWDTPQTVSRIVLWDRPNPIDQITSGMLAFSDGSSLPVGALPNDAKTGLTLSFSVQNDHLGQVHHHWRQARHPQRRTRRDCRLWGQVRPPAPILGSQSKRGSCCCSFLIPQNWG